MMTAKKKRVAREVRETELGAEIRCTKCLTLWPVDEEFYYFLNGKPHSWCKACYSENRAIRYGYERRSLRGVGLKQVAA